MELGKQIKAYRSELGLSQDLLAERIYVSRQTVSSWENDKSYPDLNSLLRLSEVFQVSLDNLIKGDLDMMKEQEIHCREDRQAFQKLSALFSVLFFATILTPIPLLRFLGNPGIALWAVLAAVTFWFSLKVEKQKKAFDILSYREISAFMSGQKLDEIAKAREEGKRPYQMVLLGIGSALLGLTVSAGMMWLLF